VRGREFVQTLVAFAGEREADDAVISRIRASADESLTFGPIYEFDRSVGPNHQIGSRLPDRGSATAGMAADDEHQLVLRC